MIPTIPGVPTYSGCRIVELTGDNRHEHEGVTVARLRSGEYVVTDPPQLVNMRFDRHGLCVDDTPGTGINRYVVGVPR